MTLRQEGDSQTMADVIVKKGETILQARVKRSSRGLVIQAKAHPMIEEFFRDRAGKQEPLPINNYGRGWTRMPEYPELLVYHDPAGGSSPFASWKPTGGDEKCYFALHQPGHPLLIDVKAPGDGINMAFLRLVGISEGMGIAFSQKGVYTEEEVKRIAMRIQQA